MTKYFKTVLHYEVLSVDEPYDYNGLSVLYNDVYEGHFSGILKGEESTELTEEEMARALISQGSDPDFLIEEEGE